MKSKINIVLFSFVLLFTSITVKAQNNDKYYIQLSDKNGSPYTVGNPSQFLSAKAITRRTNQSIAVNSSDIPVNPSYISQIAATGATVLYSIKWFNGVVIQTTSPTVLSAVNALPFVTSSAIVSLQKPKKDFEIIEELPASTQKTTSTNSLYNYGNSLNQIEMLNGVCMHDQGFNGAGMLIAVLDAGFANVNTHTAFDSLRNNNQILGTKDFTFIAPTDLYSGSTSGHGTAVLGTMGGNKPGQLVGTAPKANYWLIRSEYAPNEYVIEEYNWVAAVEFADSIGADIINSSLGYNTFDNSTQDHTMAELDGKTSIASKAATMCARKGMIVVNSAGNTGGSGWPKVTFPGDADSIITVGAVDASITLANFSSIGPSADGRIKPDVVAQGVASVVANGGGSIGTSNGTSFSSPITAGMVACLWQANPSKKNMEIIQAIKESATLYATPNNQFGYGIPDFCAAKNMLLGITTSTSANNSISLASSNPFDSEIKLNISSTSNRTMTIELIDLLGKIVYKNTISVSANTPLQYAINTSTVNSGVYTIRVSSDETENKLSYTAKLLKAKQ
jgi:serine protease AprX